MAQRRRPTPHPVPAEPAAGNELLDRRLFLTQSIALLGAIVFKKKTFQPPGLSSLG